MKKLLSILIAAILVLSLVACGRTDSTSASASSDASSTVKFTDSAGRTVEVPTKITRIAASGSLAQIVLFSLAPDMLVGVAGKWSDSAKPFIDPKYYDLPVIGQFYGKGDLNLEEVAKLAPQVIIDVGEDKDTIAKDMDGIQQQVGIPTVHITATTDTMADAYRTLGKLLGLQDKAEALAQYCETVNKRTNEIVDQIGQDKKTNLVYCLGDKGLNVIAKGSYFAEDIDLLGNNVAVVDSPSSMGSGNPVNMEQLLTWNPDVILFAPGTVYDTVGSDSTWRQLSAIKNGKYYEVPEGPYNWLGMPPSVNAYMGMVWLAQLLYPDTAKYNLYDETAKFYDLFYHAKLTEDQFKTLTANSTGKAQ